MDFSAPLVNGMHKRSEPMNENEHRIPHRFSFADGIVSRSVIGSVHLAVLLAFFAMQFAFTAFIPIPPTPVFFLVAFGAGIRIMEILTARHVPIQDDARNRLFAVPSIVWTLLLALLLAVLTRQPDTTYFGMLILPILEAAIYFSLLTTLLVAASAASISAFWVAYVSGFHSPFASGEILEASTLILVYFVVGCLVWLLVNLLRDREERLRQQMEDLNAARSKLIEKEKLAAVGRLASAVAHEIRTPVAILSSALETSASASISVNEREEMSRIATLEARRLERLTTEFLTYARPASSPFQPVDIPTLVGYIISIVQPHALQKSLQIESRVCDHCLLFGDEGQLQQALLNLMRNAIEASPQNGHISVVAERSSKESFRIRIKNTGSAIPPNIAQHIFEPFFTTKPGGTGLGLAIVRSIAERHHGEVHLEQNDPDQIVFTMILPVCDGGDMHRTQKEMEL